MPDSPGLKAESRYGRLPGDRTPRPSRRAAERSETGSAPSSGKPAPPLASDESVMPDAEVASHELTIGGPFPGPHPAWTRVIPR